MNTNNFPITWDNITDQGLLGSLFPQGISNNLPSDAIAKENAFASSPLSKNGTDVKNNFFPNAQRYTYGNFEIIAGPGADQELLNQMKIKQKDFVFDTNNNNTADAGERSFRVMLFISQNASYLETLVKNETIIPDRNEILLFLEDNLGDWSGTTMYVMKGADVSNPGFIDSLFSDNSEFTKTIQQEYGISKSDLKELLQKGKIENNALNLISGLLGMASSVVSDPVSLKFTAAGIKKAVESIRNACSFDEKSWNPAKAETLPFDPIFFPGTPNALDLADDSKANARARKATQNLRQHISGYDQTITDALQLISKAPTRLLSPFSPLAVLPGTEGFSKALLQKYISLRKTIDAALDELDKIDLSDLMKESVYAVNAFMCGIWNGFVEAICGIFSLLQYLFEGAGEISELLRNFKETAPRLLERIDECIAGFKSLNFGKIFANLAKNLKDWIVSGSVSLVEVAYFSGMFVGLMVEMTIEIVAGILFTGGVLTIEAIAAKLGEAFKAMASLLIGILKAPARIAKKTVSAILEALGKLSEFLSRGTDEILKMIDEVFGNTTKVVDDLTKKLVDDVPDLSGSELDWMASRRIGTLGGKVLTASQIRKLRSLLKKKGIVLIVQNDIKSIKKLFKPVVVDKYYYFDNVDDFFWYINSRRPPLVGGFDAVNKQFILSQRLVRPKIFENVTEIVVFHEMVHLKHFEEIGEAYYTLSELQKETYVWEQILKNRTRWTEQELDESLRYINGIRRKPENGHLKPIKIK